jgi:hypothetical protein
MAIDYHDLTAIADTLKYVYGQGIANQFADETTGYNLIPKSERQPKGLGYEFAIRYARAQGVGARAESAKLPDPLVGKFDRGRILPKYMYGSLRLTGPMIEAAKADVAAFVDGLADSVDDIYQSLIVDMNRQFWGDGFGLIATLSDTSDALTTSSTTWTVPVNNKVGTMYMQEGMLVDFFNGTAADQSAVASRISSVDVQGKTCEMEYNDGTYKTNHPDATFAGYTIATSTVASGSFMVKMGTRESTHATSNTPKEITGMAGIFDDGTLIATFENIAVATYPRWKANILDNSSVDRNLSLDLMMQGVDMARIASGKRISRMWMGLGQRRQYANLLLPDVRFQPTQLKGGYEVLTFAAGDGTVEILIDPICTPGTIYMEPAGVVQKYEMTPLGWGNLDQQMHWRSGYDEWDQFLRLYTNLGVEQRNCLVKISDLVEPELW